MLWRNGSKSKNAWNTAWKNDILLYMEQHLRSPRPQPLCVFHENQSLLLFKMYGSLRESTGSDMARLFFCWSCLDKYFHECRPHKPAETVQVAVCGSTVHCAEQKNKALLSCVLLLAPPPLCLFLSLQFNSIQICFIAWMSQKQYCQRIRKQWHKMNTFDKF